jgi:hypothetical protein
MTFTRNYNEVKLRPSKVNTVDVCHTHSFSFVCLMSLIGEAKFHIIIHFVSFCIYRCSEKTHIVSLHLCVTNFVSNEKKGLTPLQSLAYIGVKTHVSLYVVAMTDCIVYTVCAAKGVES